MFVDMGEEGRRLIALIEADMRRRAALDYRFTIKEEAEFLGISPANLVKWLNKGDLERIEFDTLRSVVNALGRDAWDALGLELPQERPEDGKEKAAQ
jgi:transcriptional regulator with XRE-family HTH domain